MPSVAPIDILSTDVRNTNIFPKEEPIIMFGPLHVLSGDVITSESSIEFSNYDVLLMPCELNKPVCFAPGNHVGNQRFRVLLSLYRQRYLQADMFLDQEECSRIVKDVITTVYQKCMPKGRFYEKDRNNQWQELPLGPSIVAIIRRCLEFEPTDSLHCEERNSKRVCRRSSAFGSVVSVDSKEDSAVISPNRFDVICDAEGLGLNHDVNHTGNNRLKVLLNLQTKRYKKSNPDAKHTIAEDVVCSIIDDASSQFLRLDELSGRYNPMSRESALACIKNCLDATTEGEKRQFRSAEVKKLMDRRRKKAVMEKIERRKGIGNSIICSTSTPTTLAVF
mmetsp:Transcript_38552/g.71070  ORF Transcript_38552/g.71070 Transcript_38552/m.71070 type:complete len:335 (+) Transcript_38552:126-1130(+)